MKFVISVIIGIYLMRKHGIAEMVLVSLGISLILCVIFQ